MTSSPIRVVLVEDSVTQREVLRRAIEEDGDIKIVAEGRNGREGIDRIRAHSPDVVVTDVWMPEATGLQLIREVLRERGVPIIVVSATLQKNQVNLSFECLAAGAVTVMEKPEGPTLTHLRNLGEELRRGIRNFSKVKICRRSYPSAPAVSTSVEAPPPADDRQLVQIIAVAASTGGPPVLSDIFGALPADFPIPILAVQHISSGFEAGFVEWLSQKTAVPVSLATHGMSFGAGIHFGPNGRHLTVTRRGRISLEPPNPGDIHIPSADRLLSSIAECYGRFAAGVVLTGMGDDGADGLKRMLDAGGRTVAQSEASSLIWGMPGESVKRGAAQLQLDPGQVAAWLGALGSRLTHSG